MKNVAPHLFTLIPDAGLGRYYCKNALCRASVSYRLTIPGVAEAAVTEPISLADSRKSAK
jgi:hypothetical protein